MMKLLGVGCTAVSRRESRCCWEHHSGYERVRAGLLLGALVCFAITTTFAQAPSSQVQALLRRGEAALDAGNFPAAVEDFEEARQLAPENLEVARGLLLSYLQAGRLDAAVTSGREASERWPRDAALRHWLGLAYFKAGQNAEAAQELRQAAKLDGASSDIHFDLALVLLSQNQSSAAAQELERALK